MTYFNSNRPEKGLPPIAPAAARVAGIRKPALTVGKEGVQAYTPPTP